MRDPARRRFVGDISLHNFGPFGQDLEDVAWCKGHDREDAVDRLDRRGFMEKIGERVDQDSPRSIPGERKRQPVFPERYGTGPAWTRRSHFREAISPLFVLRRRSSESFCVTWRQAALCGCSPRAGPKLCLSTRL